MSSSFNPLGHPLAKFDQSVEVEGKQVDVVNSWGFAAMVLDTICDPLAPTERPDGLKNAIGIAKEVIKISNSDVDIDELIQRCKVKNEGALRQAMSLIANGIQEKLEKAFESKNNE